MQGRKILTCCKFLQFKLISYSFWNIRRKVLIFFYKFDEKRARTPRWVIRFTSKLQGRKILTCCKFLQFKLISYSFWNIRRKVLIFFYKFDEKRARTPRWVIRFTSKLQGRKILTCCKFLQFKLISYSFWNIRRKVLIFFYKFDEKRARTPRWVIRFTSKLQVKKKNWSQGQTARHIFGREPSNDYFIKILFLLSKWFQTKRFLWEFPIGSYVKLSSAVAAILVGVLKWRTQFWKRATQESVQQSLVEIGSVVSEEKIFFKFHPPLFSNLHNRSKSVKVQSS